MSFSERLKWDELFEQVKQDLAGNQFTRLPWFSASEKVFMLVSAGDDAPALNSLFAAIRKNAAKVIRGSDKAKEEATRKIMKAVEDYIAPPKA
jgi:hypothetical protein